MKQVVTFKEKSVYGKTLIFAGLIGAKTFTLGHLSLIEGLGYEIHLISL